MTHQSLVLALALAGCLAACGCGQKPATMEDLNTRVITFPDGFTLRAEVMTRPEDMLRGMMFRTELAPNRGMLFIHGESGLYQYHMYQTIIPLDILWLDTKKKIVEMSPDTPPCKTRASQCPLYGGNEEAQYVLELAAGSIAEHKLRVGARLQF